VDRFVHEGAKVAVLDRNRERLREVEGSYGGLAVTLCGDVRSWDDNRRAVEAAIGAFGRLDCFIGNAGLWDHNCSLVDLPEERLGEAFDELFGVNVKGYLLGAKAALAPLVSTQGSMIFTISNAGFSPAGGGPLYTASKHAVVGLVRELAFELAPHVRVNGVAPGAIPTDLRGPEALGLANRSIADFPLEEIVRTSVPLGRLPRPEDYTGAYVFLAAEATTATGTVVVCDGGIGVRGIGRAAGGANLPQRLGLQAAGHSGSGRAV
jgi:cis-2,3-dihydrobiphenyl-2,3-diol dehydrogenase